MIDPKDYGSCQAIFSEYGLSLTAEQYKKLRLYEQILIEESVHQNVTAIRDPADIWIRHFLDAAYLLRFLPRQCSVIDIGTGGGIPAIPLAIMHPELNITMLDSERNKILFCMSAIEKIQLRADAINGRAEELAHEPQYRGKFDVAVSRAMANGSMLTELSVPFLKPDGILISMKGKQYDPETERFASAADTLGCVYEKPISYMICGEQKYLIRIRKCAETPDQYPRRFAKIKRDPL